MAGENRLLDGRHADRVGAQHPKRADLGRGLEARSAHGQVHALGEVDLDLGGRRAQHREQLRVIGVAQRREARPDGVVVRARQQVHAGHVDVIGDRHQRAGAHRRTQRPGGIGQHEDRRAGRAQRPDRRAQCFEIAALVQVRAPLEHGNRDAADRAEDGPAGVPLDARPRKAGQLLVPHHDRVLHGIGDRAQARPQHDPHSRRAEVHASSASRSNEPGSISPNVTVVGVDPGRPR